MFRVPDTPKSILAEAVEPIPEPKTIAEYIVAANRRKGAFFVAPAPGRPFPSPSVSYQL